MTISRSRRLLLLFLLWQIPAGLSAAPARAPDSQTNDRCSNIDPFVERKCVDRRIAGKERARRQLYAQALVSVRKDFAEYGNWDNRASPRFLERSQVEWKRFVDANCTVIGAFGGGSNPSITDRITGCYETELDRRIKFLSDLVQHTGEFGP